MSTTLILIKHENHLNYVKHENYVNVQHVNYLKQLKAVMSKRNYVIFNIIILILFLFVLLSFNFFIILQL